MVKRENWQILLVTEDSNLYHLTGSLLAQHNERKAALEWAKSAAAAAERLQINSFHAVLVDEDLDSRGLQLIRQMAQSDCPASFIFYLNQRSAESEIEALEAGAAACLVKSEASPQILARWIAYAVEHKGREANWQEAARREAELRDAVEPAEDMLADQEEQSRRLLLETLIRNLPTAICLIRGRDLRVKVVNPAYQALAPGKEMLGKTLDEIWPETEREFVDVCRRVLRTGQPYQAVNEMFYIRRHPDHPPEKAYFTWSLYRVDLPEEQGAGIILIANETTQRLQAEEARQVSEDRYLSLFDSIDEGFCLAQMIFNEDGKPVDYIFLEINQAFEQQTGLHNAHGRSARELVPTLEEHWFEIYGQVAQTRQAIRFENSSVPMERWFSVNAFPVGPPEDHLVGILFTDITERKRIEKALANYMKQLKQSNQALQDFAFMASHDLREPLRKIQLFSRFLNKENAPPLDSTRQDYLNRIQQAVTRMENMLDGLLDYSRVTAQGRPFQKTDLNQVVEDVLGILDTRLKRTGGQVQVEQLPEIEADPNQMHQLLQNLVSNALKFHRPEVPPWVRIYAYPVGDHSIDLVVEDNGIGFDDQFAERLFKPFVRMVDKWSYEGNGMGLAICQKIAERHGGSIQARSQPGQGASFTVRLPLSAQNPELTKHP